MISSVPWWGWAALAAALGLGELHLPGAYLVWVALGAAVTAAADAAFGLGLAAQIAVFLAAAIVSCAVGYFVYGGLNARKRPERPLNERDALMIGAQGTVCATFVAGRGKVRLGDTVWLAEGGDFVEGTPVVVKAVRGTSVVVESAYRASRERREA